MKSMPALASAAAFLGLLAGTPCAVADELVQVAQHRAGMPSEGDNTPPLFGYIARPADESRHPAVIILHGCSGLTPHFVTEAATLRSWGYVALALGSLGNIIACASPQLGNSGSSAEAKDAYTALLYLSSQPFVDPQEIVIMGYSMGGWALTKAIERGPLEESEPNHFRAAVAIYPWCGSSNGVMTVPTLILIGDRDDWTPASQCEKMAGHESVSGIERPHEGKPVKLVVYPGATHGFDRHDLPPIFYGHIITFDQTAADNAETQVKAFLQDAFGVGEPSH